MELEGDSPAPRPPATSEPVATQNIHVTPENVVALAALFRDCVDSLAPVATRARQVLRIDEAWMSDPVSEWAVPRFNDYFADAENSFADILMAEYQQHKDMMKALLATARRYGLTEELAAAGFTDLGPAT